MPGCLADSAALRRYEIKSDGPLGACESAVAIIITSNSGEVFQQIFQDFSFNLLYELSSTHMLVRLK